MKKLAIANLLLIFVFSQNLISQDLSLTGAHQEQKKEFGQLELNTTTNNGSLSTEEIIPLSQNNVNTLDKIVFGFLPYWERTNNANDNIRYDLISHLACFDFLVKPDGSIVTPAGWPWTNEINTAHAHGTKVIMTVVNFGGSAGADQVAWGLFTDISKRNKFFKNVKEIIENSNLDGVNIDFEAVSSAHRGTELNTFMNSLTTYIHNKLPGKEVSFDGPAVDWGGWNLNGLVNSVDYLIIMAYNYTGANSGYSGPVSPLEHPSSPWKSIKKTLENSYAGPISNSPEKIVLALPYYGRQWKTTSSQPESATKSYVGTTRLRNTKSDAASHGGFIWNNGLKYPWYKWKEGSSWNQVWTDNVKSMGLKFDLALSKNLGGIGIWALNYDGTRPEFWDLIQSRFSSANSIKENITEKINIYPNPSNGLIQISNNENLKIKEIELYNILGQSIMQIQPNSKSFNIDHLTAGTYILKIKNESDRITTINIIKTD